MAQQSYWRCLAMLHHLSARGIPELPSGKPQQYYCDLLARHCGEEGSVTAAITPGLAREGSPDADSDNCADEVSGAGASSDMPLVPLWQARALASKAVPRKSGKRKRDAGDDPGNVDDSSALWHVLPRAAPAPAATVLASHAPIADAPSAAAAPDRVAEDPRAASLAEAAPRAQGLGTLVDMVEGLPVRVEERGVEGAPGYYRRVFVTCPLHSAPGSTPCRVRRNTGLRQTGQLGLHEPLAYLGAWVLAGARCASRAEHMLLKPSDADTRAYALANGLI